MMMNDLNPDAVGHRIFRLPRDFKRSLPNNVDVKEALDLAKETLLIFTIDPIITGKNNTNIVYLTGCA